MRDSAPHPWAAFAVASAAVFLVSLDSTLLFAAFGALEKSFPTATRAQLSWILNGYTVVFAAMLIPGGGLADRFGRKRVFLAGVATFAIASLLCGVATHWIWLVAARAVQAVGAAMLLPSALALVIDAFPKDRRAYVVGVWGAVGALGGASGPGVGAAFVDAFGWPWAFYLNVPLGLIAVHAGRRVLHEPPPSAVKRPLDWTGVALMIAGVSCLALAIVQAGTPDWSRARILAVGGAGLFTLAVFAWRCVRTPQPLIDPTLFHSRAFRHANLAGLVFAMAFGMMFFGFFFFLTKIWHYDLRVAGWAVTPGPLTVMPTAMLTGRAAARNGHRPYLVAGSLVLMGSIFWLLLVTPSEPSYLLGWLPVMVSSGIGTGMITASISGAAVADLPLAHYAVGNATNQAIRQIGSVLGVAVGILLLSAPVLVRADFARAYWCEIVLLAATLVFALGIETRPVRTAP